MLGGRDGASCGRAGGGRDSREPVRRRRLLEALHISTRAFVRLGPPVGRRQEREDDDRPRRQHARLRRRALGLELVEGEQPQHQRQERSEPRLAVELVVEQVEGAAAVVPRVARDDDVRLARGERPVLFGGGEVNPQAAVAPRKNKPQQANVLRAAVILIKVLQEGAVAVRLEGHRGLVAARRAVALQARVDVAPQPRLHDRIKQAHRELSKYFRHDRQFLREAPKSRLQRWTQTDEHDAPTVLEVHPLRRPAQALAVHQLAQQLDRFFDRIRDAAELALLAAPLQCSLTPVRESTMSTARRVDGERREF